MKGDILSRARRIGEPLVAAAFADPLRRRLVLLLAHQERSLAELATFTGVELKRLHYHVTALRKLGLLAITRVRRRAGRAVKIYGAVAEAFFIPEKVMPSGTADALTLELRHSLDRLRDPSRDGVLYHLGADGEPRMRPVRNPATRAVHGAEYWNVLTLTRGEALRLAKDIRDCLKGYASADRAARDTYLVHFAFAPVRSPNMRRSKRP